MKFQKFLLLFSLLKVLVYYGTSDLIVQPPNDSLVQLFTDCINSKLDSTWETYVYNNSTNSLLVSSVMKSLKTPYFTINEVVDFKSCQTPLIYNQNFIMAIITEKLKDVYPIIKEQLKQRLIVGSSKVVALVLELLKERQVFELYIKLWDLKVGNLKFLASIDGTVTSSIFDIYKVELKSDLGFYLDKRIDMNGKLLFISLGISVPHSFTLDLDGKGQKWFGVTYEFTQFLESYYNARVIIVPASNKKYAGFETFFNCSYSYMSNGMENEMLNGKSDMALSWKIVEPSFRLDHIDNYQVNSFVLITPLPEVATSFVTVSKIFDLVIYILELLFLLLTILNLCWILKKHRNKEFLFKIIFSVGYRICGQYSRIREIESGPILGRFILIIWEFVTMILSASYTCKLISAFVVSFYPKKLVNPFELLEAHPNSPIFAVQEELAFLNTTDFPMDVVKKYWHRFVGLERDVLYHNTIKRPYTETVFSTRDFTGSMQRVTFCINHIQVMYATDPLMDIINSYTTPRGSVFTESLGRVSTTSIENGFQIYWRTLLRRLVPSPETNKDFKALSMEHLYAVFYILLGGYILSFVTFILEVCHKYCSGRNS